MSCRILRSISKVSSEKQNFKALPESLRNSRTTAWTDCTLGSHSLFARGAALKRKSYHQSAAPKSRDCATHADQLSTRGYQLRASSLLKHFLKLLTDYRSVKAIDGDVKPVALFLFHKETIRIKLLIGLIVRHGRL